MKKRHRYLPVVFTITCLLLVQRDDAAGSSLPLKTVVSKPIARPLPIIQVVGGGSRCSETVRALL